MLPALKSTPRKALALDASRINVERLPRTLRVLVNGVGEALAYKLAQVRGGTSLAVPKKLNPEHPLYDTLGAADYAKLVAHFGGEKIDIPKDDSLLMQHRHARVRELRAQGHSLGYVATHTHYTTRQVINIWNAGADDRAFMQPDLFAALPAALPAVHAAKAAHKARPPVVKAPIEAQHEWSAHDPFGIARRNAAQAKTTRASE